MKAAAMLGESPADSECVDERLVDLHDVDRKPVH
jgi:hypothetical protein